jgi:hypothetical protein
MTMREPPTLRAGRGLPQRTPSPQRAMADTILSKKMRALMVELHSPLLNFI